MLGSILSSLEVVADVESLLTKSLWWRQTARQAAQQAADHDRPVEQVLELLTTQALRCSPESKAVAEVLSTHAGLGRVDQVRALVTQSGVPVDVRGVAEETALLHAAARGEEESVACLLELGADVNAVDGKGCSAVIRAAEMGHEGVLRVLLEAPGVLLDVRDGRDGDTALMVACAKGEEGAVRVLVDAGATVDVVNDHGATALMLAAAERLERAVQWLLDAGADHTIACDVNRTALDYAKNVHNNAKCISLLESADFVEPMRQLLLGAHTGSSPSLAALVAHPLFDVNLLLLIQTLLGRRLDSGKFLT